MLGYGGQEIVKFLVTAALVVLIAEISKRVTWIGALLASLPLVSYMAMVWLYVDTKDKDAVGRLSFDVFWYVLPSLPFFLVLPWFLKKMSFLPALGLATCVLFVCYLGMLVTLKRFGVTL
ncbi:DUF3147 family protein [Planctomycetota bacterium]|nr:DUF3147 family protein [Planctomycetota bacterium]